MSVRCLPTETDGAVASLMPYQRVWAVVQGVKPVREEFGADCLVALRRIIYYTTAVTDHLLVVRDSAAMKVAGYAKKNGAIFSTVIHSRAGEPIDLPHQVKLTIHERGFGVATFQKLYTGLAIAPSKAKNPLEDHARADVREFCRQYGKVCDDKHFPNPIVSERLK